MKVAHHSKSFGKLVFNWILVGFPLVGIFHLLHFTYLYFIPPTWVFEYHSIESEKTVYTHWEKIQMRTSADWYRKAKVIWVDTLRCPPIYFVNQAVSQGQKYEWDKARWLWFYQWETPTIDSKCYMDSTIIAVLDYGIEKQQTIASPTFYIQ